MNQYQRGPGVASLSHLNDDVQAAAAMLYMCRVYATIGGRTRIPVYAFPWECLDVARELFLAGATEISIFAGRGADALYFWGDFMKPRALSKLRKEAAASL